MTVHAGSLDKNVLQTLINDVSVVHGDTVTIPAGTGVNWTTPLTITKAITLQGAGKTLTFLNDDVPSLRLIDVTLVADSVAPVGAKVTRITGIRFNDGARVSDGSGGGTVQFVGQGTNATQDGRRGRIDNCHFELLRAINVKVTRSYVIIDHNTCTQHQNTDFVFVNQGTDYPYTDQLWSLGARFGTNEFTFIEDNIIICNPAVTVGAKAVIDSQGGSRWVWRYNTTTNVFLEAHGTESAGRPRGTVAVEVYNNTLNMSSPNGTGTDTFLGLRSGSAVVYNNTGNNWTHVGAESAVNLTAQRTSSYFTPWGITDGRNPWDQNAVTPFPGTFTASGPNSGLTVPIATGSFAANELAGLLIRKLQAPYNVPIQSVGTGNPATVTTQAPHGLPATSNVSITAHTNSTPHIMGTYVATSTGANTFTIPVNVTVASGATGWVSRAGSGTTGSPSNFPNGSSLIISNTATSGGVTVITYEAAFSSVNNNMIFAIGDIFEINKVTAILDQPGKIGGTYVGGANLPVPPATYTQVLEPVYAWNNFIDGTPVVATASAKYNNYIMTEGIHYHANNSLQRPGYTPYTYPHPLTVTGGPGPDIIAPGAPTGVTLT